MNKNSHFLTSTIYGETYCDQAIAEIFDEKEVQQARLIIEAQLAKAQAAMGVIPQSAAVDIAKNADVEKVGIENIAMHNRKTGNDIVSLIRALGSVCDEKSREWIHFGTTSQDIHITGMALLLKRVVSKLDQYLEQLEKALAALIAKNREVIMMGRTHGQAALPITFGYKAAEWGYQIRANRERLLELKPRLLVGSIKGAVGTHASFRGKGPQLEQEVLNALGLGVSPINIQPSEERYIEFVNFLSLTATTLARISNEIRLLNKTEMGEVEEAFKVGEQVSSSTMPHKRNPEISETVQGMAYVVQGHAVGMSRVLQEHERDATRNAPEQLLIPESCMLVGRMMTLLTSLFESLAVHETAMKNNMNKVGGILLSEAVMFALAEKTQRKQEAHHIVYECSMRSFDENLPFKTALLADERVKQYLSEAEIEEVMKAENYLGSALEQADTIVKLLQSPVKSNDQ